MIQVKRVDKKMIQELNNKAENIIKKKATQKELEILQKANIREDIKDLKEKLLYKSTQKADIKEVSEEEIRTWENERRNTARIIRTALKDKITTYNIVVEAEKILLKLKG